MELALRSTGRDIFYSLCEWGQDNPAVWAPTVGGNSWRVSDDIKDNWLSIVGIIDIDAPLWRYAGITTGWNDPDMLEVGNGGCSVIEYETHFSMWAMLKAPLIIGNDIRELNLPSKVDIKRILSNEEVIAINQDPMGHQARRIWSDHIAPIGGKVIAVKCSSGNAGSYEDHATDQTWLYRDDGRIKSTSTGLCLHELPPSNTISMARIRSQNQTELHRSVTTADCREATAWDTVQFRGGSVVSRSSKLCLEVDRMNSTPASQGKLVQTAPCNPINTRVDQQGACVDHSEHQSWTTPQSTLLNLYQRQCLTIDRDAPSSDSQEVWLVPLKGGEYAVTMLNKGPHDGSIAISTAMLGLSSHNKTSYSMRDLWLHRVEKQVLRDGASVTFQVRSHGVVMLKLVQL